MAKTVRDFELRWRGKAIKIFGADNKDIFEKFVGHPENANIQTIADIEIKMTMLKWSLWLQHEINEKEIRRRMIDEAKSKKATNPMAKETAEIITGLYSDIMKLVRVEVQRIVSSQGAK